LEFISKGSGKMPKIKKRAAYLFLSFICAILMAAAVIPQTIYAEDGKSITLECSKDDTHIEGMRWKLFRAGERNGSEFVLTGDFAECQADLTDMSVENISHAAQTLESFAIARKLEPLAAGYTDKNGYLTFGGVTTGLYLAVGYPVEIEPYYYEPSPLVIEVSADSSDYHFDAYPKIVRMTMSDGVKSYTVKKVWVDDNNSFDVRPVNITVDLFRDEELYDTVTLSEENNWQYSWLSLETSYQWRVAERQVPENYEVMIEHNETQFLIRNRHKKVTDGGTVTRTTTTTTVTVTTSTSTVTGTSKTTPPTTTTTKEKIPQTGQLWWPVLPLAIGGMLLVLTGLMLRPKRQE